MRHDLYNAPSVPLRTTSGSSSRRRRCQGYPSVQPHMRVPPQTPSNDRQPVYGAIQTRGGLYAWVMTSGMPSWTLLQHRHPVSNLEWRGRKLLASQQVLVWRRRRSIRARNFLNVPGSSNGCSGARLPPISSRGLSMVWIRGWRRGPREARDRAKAHAVVGVSI